MEKDTLYLGAGISGTDTVTPQRSSDEAPLLCIQFGQPAYATAVPFVGTRLGVRTEEASTAQTNVGEFVFESQSSHLSGSD
jgi:hypothetical protein